MSNMPVTSREYKIMLNVDRFQDLKKGSEIFAALLKFLIEKEGGEIKAGPLESENRWTWYVDTPELALHRRGFSFRIRQESDSYQIMLKYRAADRYLSADQDLACTLGGKQKFEEDLTPSFASKFSKSCSVRVEKLPALDSLRDMMNIFPGLGKHGLDDRDQLRTVNGLKAYETIFKLFKFSFERKQSVKASLSFWSLSETAAGWPLVAEFSFDFDALEGNGDGDLEDFPSTTVASSNRLFRAVQGQAGWIDLSTTTKTGFAIELL
jgi:uncharacterized protein YjbK